MNHAIKQMLGMLDTIEYLYFDLGARSYVTYAQTRKYSPSLVKKLNKNIKPKGKYEYNDLDAYGKVI